MVIFFIPTLGFVIALWIGLARTENMGLLLAAKTEPASYNTYRASGILLQGISGGGDLGQVIDLPSCHGDECAGYLVIALILLVCILVIGSAMIPHFWLLSCSLLLGIMLLIAIHDLRLRPDIKGEVAANA
jgi:hypothetical protein